MKAVVCQNAELQVVERPEPTPGRGQVRLSVTRCGICGSDLHARHGLDDWADLAEQAGYDRFGRSNQPVVFGHEFSGEVAEYGPDCKRELPTGTPVVALPLLRGQLTPQRSKNAGSPLPDERAYELLNKTCATANTESLRLYKLYVRMQGFAPLAE